MPDKIVPVRIFSLVLITAITFLIYSNSFNCDWHMDDPPNIVNNRALHIENLMPDSIWQTFFANQGRAESKLYRPLACFTFAINWYIGKDHTFGYHMVNFGFHVATAAALYFLFLRLLALLYKPDEHDTNYIHNIALFAAVLWAINPIQIQAVTYIVQRMAVMAAFFYVLSMLYYVKARTSYQTSSRLSSSTCRQVYYTFLCVLWLICAMGSKENALMLPFSLVLVEWIFFQKSRTDFFRRPSTWGAAAVLLVVTIIIVFVVTGGDPFESMTGWYNKRPFSLEERLFAQPRVLLGYLSQIFYPLPERFSIAHDITLSKSLFHPWTTLPAIGVICALIIGAFLLAKRYPLLSFAILFFFLNHAIESSVLALEIVFEHRNYLPSLFLFLPIAAGLYRLLLQQRQNNRMVYGIMAIAVTFMITSVGLCTYSRNETWATVTTLWADAAKKAPNNIRPLVTLGIKLAWQDHPSDRDYHFAIKLFRRALELPETSRKTEKAEILGNIASVYSRKGENEKAIDTYRQAMELNQSFLKNRSDLMKLLILTGNFNEAADHTEYFINKYPKNPDYPSLMGFIRLWENRPEEALTYFQKALAYGPHQLSLLLNTGVALTRVKSYENGRWFLQQSVKRSPGDLSPLLAMIENRARAGDHNRASEYARRALYGFSVPVIYNRLDNADAEFRTVPITPEYIEPFIKNELKKIK